MYIKTLVFWIYDIYCVAHPPSHMGHVQLVQYTLQVDCFWNVMAHSQKPHFVFRRNGRVHLIRRGVSVQSITGSWVVRISGSNAGYTMLRGSVKSTGYPLHSPVPPLQFPAPHVRHHVPSNFNWTLPCCLAQCTWLRVDDWRSGLDFQYVGEQSHLYCLQ